MRRPLWIFALFLTLVMGVGTVSAQRFLHGIIWPEPAIVTPGEGSGPPSDAIVLYDGKNFDAWEGAKDWKPDEDGAFTVKGLLRTKQGFGDIQLHLELATPAKIKGKGQARGNNGIGLMGARYEIQVLDSFENRTYPEGQAASIYNQRPPLVNASRKPGEWQSFDVIFTTPRFDTEGKVQKPAFVTVLHNGVLVQNHTEVLGHTYFDRQTTYAKHAEKEPIVLMYHGDPVRFRNIWVREIKELEGKEGGPKGPEATPKKKEPKAK